MRVGIIGAGSPPEMVAQHLNIDQAVIPNWPGEASDILPK